MNRPRAADDFATIRARMEELRHLPRAADDFATIRARMEELRHLPRAADDFATIRARLEELRREREGAEPNDKAGQQDLSVPRGGSIRWPPLGVSSGPGRVRKSG